MKSRGFQAAQVICLVATLLPVAACAGTRSAHLSAAPLTTSSAATHYDPQSSACTGEGSPDRLYRGGDFQVDAYDAPAALVPGERIRLSFRDPHLWLPRRAVRIEVEAISPTGRRSYAAVVKRKFRPRDRVFAPDETVHWPTDFHGDTTFEAGTYAVLWLFDDHVLGCGGFVTVANP